MLQTINFGINAQVMLNAKTASNQPDAEEAISRRSLRPPLVPHPARPLYPANRDFGAWWDAQNFGMSHVSRAALVHMGTDIPAGRRPSWAPEALSTTDPPYEEHNVAEFLQLRLGPSDEFRMKSSYAGAQLQWQKWGLDHGLFVAYTASARNVENKKQKQAQES